MLRLIATLTFFLSSVLALPMLEEDLLDMQTGTRAAAKCSASGADCNCTNLDAPSAQSMFSKFSTAVTTGNVAQIKTLWNAIGGDVVESLTYANGVYTAQFHVKGLLSTYVGSVLKLQMKVVGQVITTTQYETSGTAYCNTHSYFAGSSRVCSTVTLSADGKSLRLQSDIDPFYAASKVTYGLAVVATLENFQKLDCNKLISANIE